MWHSYNFKVNVSLKFNKPPTAKDIEVIEKLIRERLEDASLGTESDWTPLAEGSNKFKIKGTDVKEVRSCDGSCGCEEDPGGS